MANDSVGTVRRNTVIDRPVMASARSGDEAEPRGTADLETQLTFGKRIGGAALTGVVGAVGMYVVLAVAALVKGHSAAYPFNAVQAMMSGRRVLPDHPIPSVRGPQNLDYFWGPLWFLLPALAVALIASGWIVRRQGGLPRTPSAREALLPAGVLTGIAFAVLVVALGFWEASGVQQRTSSGYGVRELGMVAWVLGHLAYLGLFTMLLGPLTDWVAKDRTRSVQALRGEQLSAEEAAR